MARHLTLAERDLLAQLLHQGHEQNQIAATLRRSPATICRELKRNRTGGAYHAGQAHEHSSTQRASRSSDTSATGS
jgi:IS30 family transposase